jgi:hypothetical protein
MVDDQIGLAPSNHGSTGARFTCLNGCAPAIWQQSNDSEFIKAINSQQETFPGISYTEVFTHNDEVVTPNSDDTGSSSLHGGGGEITNVAVQEICPADLNEHNGLGTVDNVAYALAMDALTHSGPGVNPLTLATDAASTLADDLSNIFTHPPTPAEPPLKCYVTASCGQSAAVKAKCTKKKHKRHKRLADSAKKKHEKCKKKRKKRR